MRGPNKAIRRFLSGFGPTSALMIVTVGSGAMAQSAPQSVPQAAPQAGPQSVAQALQAPVLQNSPQGKEWPRVIPKADVPKVMPAWTDAEIAAAQKRCVEMLKGIDIVAVGATPIRENAECGAPAPIELISVGKSPQVTFSPTVTVTCDMAAALHKWVVQDLQPLAKKQLGAPLIRIDTMSSYSCRNAYGRVKSRLSEHGRANAIDIRGFTTAKADTTDLLADWGMTAREIQAQVAAAKAAAQKAEAAKALAAAATGKAGQGPATPPSAANSVATGTLRPGLDGQPPTAATLAPPQQSPPAQPGLSVPGVTLGFPGLSRGTSDGPFRLGGPKPPAVAAAPAPDQRAANHGNANGGANGRMQFLRNAHTSACRIFGTVLGPEANNAHKNHFHLDMAERATSSYCE